MTTDAVGGVWTYSTELANELSKDGTEVLLATMGPRPSSSQRTQITKMRGVELRESEFKLEWMKDPWEDVAKAGEWLLALGREFQPDVVHLNGYAHGSLAWNAPVVLVAHSCVLSWWRAVNGGEELPSSWFVYREKAGRGLRAADCVISPTDAMLASVQEFYGPLRNCRVIANGRASGLFRPGDSKEPFIIAAGRLWDEAKNIAALLEISSELDWPVCLAGSGDVSARNCRLLGHLNTADFAQLLGQASIFCLPARYEPFGLCILEAALSGCALVLGDIQSLRENWNGAAIFVAPEDRHGLARTLNELIRDVSKREELARRARLRGLCFTTERMSSRYREIYAELIARHSREQAGVNACAL